MHLIVGQGNPGAQYARTKHNVGFWVLDKLSADYRLKGKALIAQQDNLILLKPTTFYNATGDVVAPLVNFYKIPPENILVIQDELDLPVGKFRFKQGGSNAGNNGLESISRALGTKDFHRLRIGIGKPPSKEEGAAWVLSGFHPELLVTVEKVIDEATKAALEWKENGIDFCKKKYSSIDLLPKPEPSSEEV